MTNAASRVLVVDDNDTLRRALVRALSARGHTTTGARDGRAAVEILRGGELDVIVSDIRMPDMDGMELLQAAREIDPDLAVLLITGTPELETAMKAVEYGAFEYLAKPLDMNRLDGSIRRAVSVVRSARARRSAFVSAGHDSVSGTRLDDRTWTGATLAGRYKIGALIGEGGMGAVYEAEREDLGNMKVAIKVLHPGFSSREDLMQRFRREAEVVAALDHPNIVKVLDFHSSSDGPTFFVMERLRGAALGSVLATESQLSIPRSAFIGFQILAALSAAHRAGVIHRDLKPDNVFLTSVSGMRDIVKLLDFGIAKHTGVPSEQKLTQTGVVLGTPAYMAPEYARGGKVDARSDVYAVGCVLYEALTGKEPFTAENYNALLFAIQEKDPVSLTEVRPDVPLALAEVIQKAMAKNPDLRFSTADEMAGALEPWVVPESSVGHTPPDSLPLSSAPTVVSDSPPPRRGSNRPE